MQDPGRFFFARAQTCLSWAASSSLEQARQRFGGSLEGELICLGADGKEIVYAAQTVDASLS